MKNRPLFCFTVCLLISCIGSMRLVAQSSGDTIFIKTNLANRIGEMRPIWGWFGYDEPNYTYMKDGKALLTELAQLSKQPVYVRAHNMLTTGDGKAALKWGSTNVYTEDSNGNPEYNWKIVDSIFDTYVARGMKPMAEIGFMPEALSVKPQPYQHTWQPGQSYTKIFTGWRYPPKDYNKWSELVYQWVSHTVSRYGKKEVADWYWELWNEPDIGYWGGTVQEFCKLYDYTADAVKRAFPEAKIGGPHVTGPLGRGSGYRFLETFLKHCLRDTNYVTRKIGTPLDFVAFHAKGAPQFLRGRVVMGMGTQLRAINNGFQLVSSFPELKNIPIIIGESDPEGCAACGINTNPENGYRNGTMFSSYTAAVFARKYAMADAFNVNLTGAVSWAFEFEDQPWFYGFRDLATNGVDKPVLNVFRMFGKMSGQRLAVTGNMTYDFQKIRDSGVRKEPDVNAFATTDKKSAAVMVWNYHDKDSFAAATPVHITIEGMGSVTKATLTQYRIDSEHSNSFEAWKKMGSPQQPTQEQITLLKKSGQLTQLEPAKTVVIKKGQYVLNMLLPRQAVSFVQLNWK